MWYARRSVHMCVCTHGGISIAFIYHLLHRAVCLRVRLRFWIYASMVNEDCRYRTTVIEPHYVASRLLAILAALAYIVGVLRRQWLETEGWGW